MNWLADAAKFAPGYLSFIWLVGAGIRKIMIRRHRSAHGPAEELRLALEEVRRSFQDLIDTPQLAGWFADDDRRDISERLCALADRVGDHRLKQDVMATADTWLATVAAAPRGRPAVGLGGLGAPEGLMVPQHGDAMRLQHEGECAKAGLEAVRSAIQRLNELERKTIGR